MLRSFDGSLATVHYLFLKWIQVTVFTFCHTYISQESFLKKSIRKRCLEPRTFVYSLVTCHFLFGCRYTNGYPLTTPPAHWKWRGTAYRWEAWLIEFTVNQTPDNKRFNCTQNSELKHYWKLTGSLFLHGYNLDSLLSSINIFMFLYRALCYNYPFNAGIKLLRATLPDKILFTGDFASWTMHFVNICMKNQQIHQLFIQFINCVW
jgi:hypothetical protein